MTDQHWQKILRAIALYSKENNLVTFGELLQAMRVNWDTLANEASLDTYLANKEQANLLQQKADLEAALADVDTQLGS